MPQMQYLDTQEKFNQLWRRLSLEKMIPLRFDAPKENEIDIPYARGRVREVRSTRYSGIRAVVMRVDLSVYIPQADQRRDYFELAMVKIEEEGWATAIVSLSEFRCVESQESKDDVERFAGKGVDVIAKSFELWFDITR